MGTNEKLNCINKKQTVKCRYEELQMLVYQKKDKSAGLTAAQAATLQNMDR